MTAGETKPITLLSGSLTSVGSGWKQNEEVRKGPRRHVPTGAAGGNGPPPSQRWGGNGAGGAQLHLAPEGRMGPGLIWSRGAVGRGYPPGPGESSGPGAVSCWGRGGSDGREAARRSGRHRACAVRTEHPRSAEPAGAEVTRAAAPVQPPGAAVRGRPGGGQRGPLRSTRGRRRCESRAGLSPKRWGAALGPPDSRLSPEAPRRAAAAVIAASAARRARNGARFGSSRRAAAPAALSSRFPCLLTAHGAVAALQRPPGGWAALALDAGVTGTAAASVLGAAAVFVQTSPPSSCPRPPGPVPGWGRSAGNCFEFPGE